MGEGRRTSAVPPSWGPRTIDALNFEGSGFSLRAARLSYAFPAHWLEGDLPLVSGRFSIPTSRNKRTGRNGLRYWGCLIALNRALATARI